MNSALLPSLPSTRLPAPAWLLLLLLVALAAVPVSDPDAVMHASIGRWMVEHRSLLPTPDPFVWTDAGADHQHEWAAQLLIGGLVKVFGLAGLRIYGALLAGLCGWMVWRALLFHGASVAHAAAGLGLWMVLVEPHLAPRPHLIGWAFAIGVLSWGLGDLRPWRQWRWLGWLLVTAAWANFHSSVLLVVVYAGLHWLATATTQWRRAGLQGLVSSPPLRQATLRLVVFSTGALMQPLGAGLVSYVLASQAIGRWSDEWLPLLRGDVWAERPAVLLAFAGLTLAVVAEAYRSRKSLATTWVFPGLPSAVACLLHAAMTRRMTVYALVAILWWARQRAERAQVTPLDRQPVGALISLLRRGQTWLAVALTGLALAPMTLVLGQPGSLRAGAFPTLATAFLQGSALQGRLFNPDPWGGWLAWQLWPHQQVFLDGRILISGSQVVADLVALQARGPGVAQIFARYNLELFVQRTRDYLLVPPPDPKQWRVAWWDRQAIVLVREGGPHWSENLKQLCAFYRDRPTLRTHTELPASWPPALVLSSALARCPP